MLRTILFSAGLIFLLGACSRNSPQSERELATRVLAEYVRKTAAPKSVLVISNPFTREAGRPAEVYAFEKAGIAGLRAGFGEAVMVEVDFPPLKEEVLRDPGSVQVDPRTTTPLSFLVADGAFGETARRHPKVEVIVSLIGLPVNLNGFAEWKAASAPRFALLLPDWRMIGGAEEIAAAFRSGKLIAAVVNKPNAPEGAAAGDSKADFEKHYLLVTAENAEALLRESPAVFGLR